MRSYDFDMISSLSTQYSGLRLWVEYQFKLKGGAMILNTMSFNIFKLSNTKFFQVSSYTIVQYTIYKVFLTIDRCSSPKDEKKICHFCHYRDMPVSRIFNFNFQSFKLTRMIINFFLTTLRVLASNRYDDAWTTLAVSIVRKGITCI